MPGQHAGSGDCRNPQWDDKFHHDTHDSRPYEISGRVRACAENIEGKDVCRKICILSSLAFGRQIKPDWVHTQGIRAISPEDVSAAQKADYVIKLVGRAKKNGKGLYASVSPALVSKSGQLANVSDEFNAVIIKADSTDTVMFYGKGAGKCPTAAAVLMDVAQAVRACGKIPEVWWDESQENTVLSHTLEVTPMLVRMKGAGKDTVGRLFGEVRYIDEPGDSCAFITAALSGSEMEARAQKAKSSGAEVLSALRILEY